MNAITSARYGPPIQTLTDAGFHSSQHAGNEAREVYGVFSAGHFQTRAPQPLYAQVLGARREKKNE